MKPRSHRGNLPADVGTFIGRRHEVAQVRRSLEGSRLVTLVGAGGVGKTRLAVRVAGQLRAYDDGAWLVELAAVTDPDAVASTVADVLGVADRSSRSVLSALASYVEDKQLLLVLDNCEHQVDACARLVGKLLAVAPRLCVLATSRQPLAVEGEHLIAVPPLSYPDPELLPPGNLSEFEAVRLFMERAKAVVPDFDLTPATRTAVAAVCRRVDGLPLAIELAAARLRVLSVTQLLDRLDDRLDVLRSRSPVAPTRQQTLRATLDWSYDMCSPAEQILWARLSVFADGFDLEAAEYVCSGLGLDAGTLFEVMAALIDKSILLRLDGVGNAARYGMLHTLRGYGRERLAAAGEQAARRDRHRAYYWELARRAQADRISPREVSWLLRLRQELDNLRAAMSVDAVGPDDRASPLEIAVAVQDLWLGGGRYREGQQWLIRALAVDRRPTPARVQALAQAATLTMLVGDADADAGGSMLAEAQELAERIGDPAASAAVLQHRASRVGWLQPGDAAAGLALAEQSLSAARAAADLRLVSLALLLAATITAFSADPRASDYAGELRALGEAHGAEWTAAWGQLMEALARWQQGDDDHAAGLVRQALPVFQLVHDSWAAGGCLAVLAATAAAAGQYDHAARLICACETVKRRDGAALAELGPFAERQARTAEQVLAALGETAYAAAVEASSHWTLDEAITYALGRAPGTPAGAAPRAPAATAGPLTRRQEQIADLVAEGLSNRDIATRLFISQRTAESHIEHILTKLGFTTRTQIARWVAERRHTP